jgi:hypothetical protein
MAGKGSFIKVLAGEVDVRGPLRTTAKTVYWLPGQDSNLRPFD